MTLAHNQSEKIDVSKYVYDIHIYPTYAVQLPQREKFRPSAESIKRAQETRLLRIANRNESLEEGEVLPPVLSAKAKRKLINAVNWLISSAKTKKIFSKSSGKSYSFKLNFITLTLPTTNHDITDHFFKSKLLHNFLSTANYKFGLSNYVWKVECQENGNIHAHITTDVFMPWQDVRDTWNNILRKHGLLEDYTKKHSRMSKTEYITQYAKGNLDLFNKLGLAYEKGVEENWDNPNTTDVHAVHKVKDLGSYLAKYFSKEEEGRRRITGRVWSCSNNLSSKNKLVLECTTDQYDDVLQTLANPLIEAKELIQEGKDGKSPFSFGLIYFFKHTHWGTVIKGKLLDAYNAHRYAIRNSKSNLLNLKIEPIPIQENYFNRNVIELKLPSIKAVNMTSYEQTEIF